MVRIGLNRSMAVRHCRFPATGLFGWLSGVPDGGSCISHRERIVGPCFWSKRDNQVLGLAGRGKRSPTNAVSSPIRHGKPIMVAGPTVKASPCRATRLRPVAVQASWNSNQAKILVIAANENEFRHL